MPAPSMPLAVTDLLVGYLDACQNGITIIDASDMIIYQNKAQARMFSLGEQNMTGRPVDDLFTWLFANQRGGIVDAPDLDSWLRHAHEKIHAADPDSFEMCLQDGRWLLVTRQSAAQSGVIFICTDISEQKWLQTELVRLHTKLELLAQVDDLTGVATRRHFMQQLTHELARLERFQQPLCLVMIDLDLFKKINDQYGHPAGDAVLRHFAGILSSQIRATDAVGRLGGEEFAIVMPATARKDAEGTLTRVREFIASHPLDQVAPGFCYTFSAGLIEAAGQTRCDEAGLLSQADRALYQAKSEGRNCTVSSSFETPADA